MHVKLYRRYTNKHKMTERDHLHYSIKCKLLLVWCETLMLFMVSILWNLWCFLSRVHLRCHYPSASSCVSFIIIQLLITLFYDMTLCKILKAFFLLKDSTLKVIFSILAIYHTKAKSVLIFFIANNNDFCKSFYARWWQWVWRKKRMKIYCF